jgi:hypothetical protein
MEKMFPHCGKSDPIFPHRGKKFSTLWKTSTILHFSFFILNFALWAGCSQPEPQVPALPAGQDFSISAAMSTNQIRIGDPVDLTLTALHRADTSVSFPNLASGKDVVVREAKTATEDFTNGLRRTVQNIRLTSLTVTNHIIGADASILLSTPAGVQSNAYPFLSLEVLSSLAPGEKDPRPAHGELAQWPAPPSRWLWIALALLVLLAAAFLALRKFLTTPRTFLNMPPPIPPHQIALDALADLRARGWIEALHIEPFYVALSGIVRRYLEGRFGLRAPERTTEEFIRDALSSRKLSDATATSSPASSSRATWSSSPATPPASPTCSTPSIPPNASSAKPCPPPPARRFEQEEDA